MPTTLPPYVLKSRSVHRGNLVIHVAEVGGAGVYVHDYAGDRSTRWSRGNDTLEAAQAEADAALLASGHQCDSACSSWMPHPALDEEHQR